ncbi:hypothetical protein ASD15_27995 [Massilia sp. Root351]|uniref:hypothetical protein n=1 Tax=Massilia sp. Root351 TaxID=1736522 RepID=UPI00070E2727|nr:hypothetical protein [Massilia sp. Root351]KQV87892.1 hypothetical protein ASD15_27995 [Massilia sp. Root351]
MSEITGAIDLSKIPEDEFDPELDLRVAVVRDGAVLGSTVVKAGNRREPVRFAVQFEAPLLPGATLPCPVRLLAGPDLDDMELMGIDTLSHVVDLAGQRADPDSGGDTGQGVEPSPNASYEVKVDVGILVVDISIYNCWLFCCRTYTLRGRVVCRRWQYNPATGQWSFCDAPVPGATVEAYDVDRFFFWYHRDLIKSAVTDVNGNFVIRFRWCCLRWRPWLLQSWALDPDMLNQIQELLARAGLRLPPAPPGPGPDPLYLQQLAAQASMAPKSRMPAAPGVVDEPMSAETLMAVLPPSPELAALHIWPWWDRNDCAPDVVFRVTQLCGDTLRVIRNESNAQIRWDIPANLHVTLLANSLACCLPSCFDPECPECLKVTFVGCTATEQIGVTAGPPDLRGYAYPALTLDRPFYGSLQIRGGVGSDVDYFKVQVSRNGGPWSDLAEPAFGGFTRSYWDGSSAVVAPAPAFTPILKNGQTVMVTRRHYEDLHPAIPRFGGAVIWYDYDTLFYFDTLANPGLTPDALYQLRFVGYSADAADNLVLSSERILPSCGQQTTESVYIRIDNQANVHPLPTALHPCGPGTVHDCTVEPDCHIRQICVNEGTPGQYCISACDMVRLSTNDTLTVHFSVTVPPTTEDGHLGAYTMTAEYGVAQTFDIGTGLHGTFVADPTFEVGPSYAEALMQGAPRPHWYGGHYKVTLRGSDFERCCAYILRLRAWKRTANCNDPSQVHRNEFEVAFTILRPELCPDVCPEPGETQPGLAGAGAAATGRAGAPGAPNVRG